jgi:hypothetical protein
MGRASKKRCRIGTSWSQPFDISKLKGEENVKKLSKKSLQWYSKIEIIIPSHRQEITY